MNYVYYAIRVKEIMQIESVSGGVHFMNSFCRKFLLGYWLSLVKVLSSLMAQIESRIRQTAVVDFTEKLARLTGILQRLSAMVTGVKEDATLD